MKNQLNKLVLIMISLLVCLSLFACTTEMPETTEESTTEKLIQSEEPSEKATEGTTEESQTPENDETIPPVSDIETTETETEQETSTVTDSDTFETTETETVETNSSTSDTETIETTETEEVTSTEIKTTETESETTETESETTETETESKGIDYSADEPVDSVIDSSNNSLTADVVVGDKEGDIYADIPTGVKIEEGKTSLTLSVNTIKESGANISLSKDETLTSIDVHVEGIAADNTVPVQVTLKGLVQPGLNNNNIKLYHVENGVTVEMTLVTLAELDAHNEFYYDPVTGDVIVSMASFSEVAVVADGVNHWDGKSATAFAGGNGTENAPYLIANASQLAYFRDIVDGTAEWSGDRTFQGQYVKLANDVILNHHDEQENLFDPIGWGYDNASYNRDGMAGKVFMGTFDGDGHAIHGLYQNGWDLEAATKTDYTYTNCGFGLFAAVKDATIKNLTMKHANVVVECVEAGVVVGLAQGNCTFENIYIYHASIANYQRPAGGVVGEVSPGYEKNNEDKYVPVESVHKFINVHVGSSTTVGSLWGDFDTPCGGVIGAYWDDSSNTKVYMDSVDVSCVLDVYSDVTAAYQWYAYRRAGMLIGNTDRPAADGKNAQIATAPFLEVCDLNNDGKSECVVIYDDWRNYTYCEFTNDNNPGKNYPWVRVEPGLNCSSYSNPRYGHPIDAAGKSVIDDIHLHLAGDGCTELIQFNQLYGGGQGVYGQSTHAGVVEGKYTVTFIGADGDIADVQYVTDNSKTFSLAGRLPDISRNGQAPLKWEDANGEVYATRNGSTWTYNKSINAGNLVDMVFYPEWPNEYNIYFLNHDGKVLYYESFTTGQPHTLDTAAIDAQRLAIQNELDNTQKVIVVNWNTTLNSINFAGATDDIIVKIELNLSSSSITLRPVYDGVTNQLIRYQVVDVNATDENRSINIPSHVGHVPVDEITEGAFDGFDNLTAVKIPVTMNALGKGMFPGGLFNKQTVTIYYTGTYQQWEALIDASSDDWDDGLGDGSRVFFLDANGKVDNTHYVEYYKKNVFSSTEWIHHSHGYVSDAPDNCPAKGHYKSFTDYYNTGRPDYDYWAPVTAED